MAGQDNTLKENSYRKGAGSLFFAGYSGATSLSHPIKETPEHFDLLKSRQ